MKDVVKQVIAIDTAFTRLKMVTQASDEQLSKMKSTYISLAREMKVSLSTVTDAAEAWLRTGMNAKDANDALQASIVLSTVAFMDGATATQYLVAAQKAYGLSAQDLMGVVDKLAVLDSKAATTAADLGEALSMSASSAGLAGIELDKYLAILATTSETTQQSASNIGNAWKTILARLQQVKLGSAMDEEGQDISNVDKLLKEYNIDLLKETDNLENMEGLLDTLGERWKNYTAMQKSEIATIVAGVRQRDKLIAALNNYDRVIELTTKQTEEEGAAQKKMQDYMESTQAKIDNLKTAWTELADATLKSDWVEWFVTVTTKIVDFTKKAGGLVPVVIQLAGAFAMLKGGAIGKVLGGLAIGGMAIYQISQLAQNKWIEQNITQQQQKTEELVGAQEKERKSVSSLMKEYIRLLSIKERTEEQDKKLKNVSQELAKSLNVTAESISDLGNSFKEYSTAYTEYMVKSLEASLLSYMSDAERLEAEVEKTQSYIDRLEMKSRNPSVYAGSSALADDLQLFLEKLFHGKEFESAKEALESYRREIKSLQDEIKFTSEEGAKMLSLLGDAQNWDRSEAGAKKLKVTLSEIDSIMDNIKKKRDDETDEESKQKLTELISLYETFAETLKTQYEQFVSTDFVITEYYDKQLKALKEQKEIEDELAKQKEEQQKIADAELKVQESALEVEKARAALAEAREKKIKVFRMGKGMVYEEDTAAISSAQDDLSKSLDGYQEAMENLAKVQGSQTEKLISAIEKLEKAYDYAMLDNADVRKFFQTPENLEKFQNLSQDEQLAFLMSFMSDENKAKASALWGLDEGEITELGKKVRDQVFGIETGGAELAGGYLATKATETEQTKSSTRLNENVVIPPSNHSETELTFKDGKLGVSGATVSSSEATEQSSGGDGITEEDFKNWQRGTKWGKFHSGGIVGEKAFSSDTEMYAKLLKGEIVLPQGKFNQIIDRVQHSSNSESTILNIGNVSLPNVDDADSFVRELQRISFAR